MSDSVVFSRRDFLKLVGLGVAGAAAGCSKPPADKLLPYVIAPETILPGVPYYYASTCRECPAGCGILVKSREGRAIKLEGNPQHPIGAGGVCVRGHAALQGLYDPDRIKTPMLRSGSQWKSVTWDDALALLGQKLGAAKGKVLLVTGHETGALAKLAGEFASALGGRHVMVEPFAYEAVRAANQKTFGMAAVPRLDLAAARGVISFGADFLETFGSPVDQARGFAALRARRDADAGWFVSVEPRLSLTGANADEWVAVRAGGEMALALGLAKVILDENLGAAVAERGALASAVQAYTPEAVQAQTDVAPADLQRLARKFAKGPTLAIAGGIATQGPAATALVAAVNLLNYVAGNVGKTLLFDRPLAVEGLATFAQLTDTAKAMAAGQYDVAIAHGANPLYATPRWAGLADAFAKVPFKVSLSGALDETTEQCDLVLPSSHPLESFGDAESARGIHSLLQPSMQRLPMFDSRPTGGTLIAAGKAAGVGAAWPAEWFDYLKASWQPLYARFGNGRDFEQFWQESLQKGGVFETPASPAVRWLGAPAFNAAPQSSEGDYALIVTPSNSFLDGRGANKPWLQEVPDMTSKTVWGSWAEIHPETAARLGVQSGDPVTVQTAGGSVDVPAYVYAGIRKDTVAIALGQGHTSYGRYATGRGVNALALVTQATDPASGALAYQGGRAKLSRGTKAMELFQQQQEKDQHGRGFAQVIPIAALLAGTTKGEQEPAGKPKGDPNAYPDYASTGVAGRDADPAQSRLGHHTEPKEHAPGYVPPAHSVSAFAPEKVVRHPSADPIDVGSYKHAKHRWAMAIDLNACTGCAACVVACYAENNIPVVGPDLIRRGREMAWIRIDRFEERIGDSASSALAKPAAANGAAHPNDVRFVPMMCQHCSDAPCEMVCPVYATYHNPEGLNAQVYNRCVGTRYCSNNCPYKVRAFNWFDYSAPEKTTFAFPEPLNWQLNPDVTVRSKGVMEKCTMCIQRILEGKGNAKDENRDVRDGEIQTACSQSCPTQAITFGDLLDPQSAVHQKSLGERKYWVLEELNTRPGVTYLQKIQRETASEARA